MAVLLALVSAGVYGTADFCGGLSARRHPAAVVVAVSQIVGCLLALGATLVWSGDGAATGPLAWGGAAGLASGAGVMLFYWGLAHGTMSQVAPIAAVCSAIIPVVFSVAVGETPGPVAWVGIALAIPAIGLISRERPEDSAVGVAGPDTSPADRRVFLAGLGAGVGFGLYFVLFDQAGTDAGMWPAVTARTVSSVLALGVVIAAGQVAEIKPATNRLVIATGALDFAAIATYLLATSQGILAVVAVLTSLYPASTVALARVVLHEHLHRDQLVGVGLGLLAVALIAVG